MNIHSQAVDVCVIAAVCLYERSFTFAIENRIKCIIISNNA